MAIAHVPLIAISWLCLCLPLGLMSEEKKHDDNSWLLMCDMYHTQQQNDSDKFVINAIVSPTGCQLTCVVLESSSQQQKGFFDRTVTHLHNLNDGIYCKRDHVSVCPHYPLHSELDPLLLLTSLSAVSPS